MSFSLLFPAVTAAFKALLRKGEGREGGVEEEGVNGAREREGGTKRGRGHFRRDLLSHSVSNIEFIKSGVNATLSSITMLDFSFNSRQMFVYLSSFILFVI